MSATNKKETTTASTITKGRGSNAAEEVVTLKLRVQELERQVADYKGRLDDLRKAKSTLIVKKEKEYVSTGVVQSRKSKGGSEAEPSVDEQTVEPPSGPCEECENERAKRIEAEKQHETTKAKLAETERALGVEVNKRLELERTVQGLVDQLDENKNLIAAMKVEKEDLLADFERRKKRFQEELSDAIFKEEEATKEVKKWEESYKQWMSMMESRVTHLMETNAMLQQLLEDQNPDREETTNKSTKAKK